MIFFRLRQAPKEKLHGTDKNTVKYSETKSNVTRINIPFWTGFRFRRYAYNCTFITVLYSFHEDHENVLFKARFRYRQVHIVYGFYCNARQTIPF